MTYKAEEILALSRALLKKNAPYIAPTLYGLTPVPTEECDKMGVTPGMVLYYNPTWMENEPAFQVTHNGKFVGYLCFASCLYHECQHVVRGLYRMEALPDPKLANIAADAAINWDLQRAGWVLPPWVIYPETLGLPGGKTLEWYYKMLQRDPGKVRAAIKQVLQKAGQIDEHGNVPEAGPLAGQCGGAAGNAQNPELEQRLDEEAGRAKSDVNRIQKATIQSIKEHIKANGRGSAPGFSEEDLNFTTKPSKIDWRRQLSRVVRRTTGAVIAGGDDFSLRRPSKRSMLLGVIRPGMIDQQCEVAFIRDTSGSMGPEQLTHANNEAIAVLKQIGIDEVWFMDADTKIHTCKRMRLKDIPVAKAVGRGGTSFVEPLEKAAKLRPKPDVVIYLTDGDGYAPKKKPSAFEVVWCIVPSFYTKIPSPWGHAVVCSDD